MEKDLLLIGESKTSPACIYLKCLHGTMRAVRITDSERLNTMELKELSREILIQRKLRSPYIAEVLSCLVVGWSVRMESEYFAFGSCCDIISAHFNHGLPLAACTQIVRGVAHGLEYIHEQGIIHRSIRASHVFITHQGQVKLSGFRYAIELKDKRRSHEYRFEEVGLPWKAPELLEQNCHGFGTKIDIYSLGIFACEIVNGSIPFLDKAPTLIMLEKLKGSQPLVMDRTTLDEHLGDEFDLYLKRKIPRHFHELVNKLTLRDECRRPTAKVLLKEPFLRSEPCGHLVEKLKPMIPMTRQTVERQLELNRARTTETDNKGEEVAKRAEYSSPLIEWDL